MKTSSRRANMRQAILDTSAKLIQRKGIEALTLREIGVRLGVSRMAPYRHFADKSALLAALSEVGFTKFADTLEEAYAAARPAFPDRLAALGLAYLRFAAKYQAHYQVMFAWATKTGEGEEVWSAPALRSFAILEQTIREGQLAGQVRPGDPADLARIVWATSHGLALLQLETGLCDGGPASGLSTLCSEVLLHGLSTQG